MPRLLYNFRKPLLNLLKLLRIKFINTLIRNYVKKNGKGPDKNERDATEVIIWGRVTNKNNEKYEEAYKVMEGYNFTAIGAAEIILRVLNNEVEAGTKTPSLAFGGNFMEKYVIDRLF